MAIRRVTGAVSPSELIFADANALGATYDGSGTTIERGETFTLPAGGSTAVSNGALRLEALKGDCTITNNGNSTLTNASGVDGTIVMRSGASDFPAFVRNSSMGSMSTPAREDFTGDVSGTINSNVTFPAGTVLQVVYFEDTDANIVNTTADQWTATGLSKAITTKADNSNIYISVNIHAYISLHTADDWNIINFRILRGSNDIWYSNSATNVHTGYYFGRHTTSDTDRMTGVPSMAYLDTGNTADAGTSLTYSVEFSNRNGNEIQITSNMGNSSISLMEIMP